MELTRLDRPPAGLEARLTRRVQAMLAAGLIDEVRRLLPAGLKDNPSAARAIGYRETIAMLEGALPPDALAAEIVKNTRALVKKQRTWFRTQLPPHRVVEADAAAVENVVWRHARSARLKRGDGGGSSADAGMVRETVAAVCDRRPRKDRRS